MITTTIITSFYFKSSAYYFLAPFIVKYIKPIVADYDNVWS